jgi:hypothetical protein
MFEIACARDGVLFEGDVDTGNGYDYGQEQYEVND